MGLMELTAWLREQAEIDDSGDCPVAAKLHRKAAAELEKLNAANVRLLALHSEIVGELYGQGFYIVGWHRNGEYEPLDSFFEDNGWLEVDTREMPATHRTDTDRMKWLAGCGSSDGPIVEEFSNVFEEYWTFLGQ